MENAKELATFFKQKGYIYPSSEIYGGVSGLYDYGHLGTRLKKNFEELWRDYFLGLDDNFHEIETANIMHEKVFEASGHKQNFTDPIVKCTKCEFFERADHLVEKALNKRVEELSEEELSQAIKENNLKCPICGGELGDVSVLNMMFPLSMGVGRGNQAYLRPETAQSPYVNFKLQFELLRRKLPMGLALVGRAYRNEISPRNLTLRQREFTQAELQIFFNPNTINEHPNFDEIADYKIRTVLVSDREPGDVVERTATELVELGFPKYYVFHLAVIQSFYLDVLKLPPQKFRIYELNENEKAFYNKYHMDLEVDLNEHGFTEIGGLHYRTDHDLKGHQEVSGEKMEVMDDSTGEKIIPHVLELSFGVDRNVYALLDVAYKQEEDREQVIMKLPSVLAPVKVAVLPLVGKLEEPAREIYEQLRSAFECFFDRSGSIGRRYARQDENGTPICVTVDFDTAEDNSVTLRQRDTAKQIRVSLDNIEETIMQALCDECDFSSLGKPIN